MLGPFERNNLDRVIFSESTLMMQSEEKIDEGEDPESTLAMQPEEKIDEEEDVENKVAAVSEH
ncbi:hypothetical protein QQP08_006302 [Theobroma cacao]|nr:hypothetical protein QQP08_006302 [Theobroma cacao]